MRRATSSFYFHSVFHSLFHNVNTVYCNQHVYNVFCRVMSGAFHGRFKFYILVQKYAVAIFGYWNFWISTKGPIPLLQLILG